MEESLISIIIPVYNVEMYLAACLDSVLSQSYRNMEVILINDGSTDLSLQIAETYKENDDRLKVYTFVNEGQAEARNHGLSVATGNYIMFVDADDILLPDALKILMEIFDTKDETDIVEGKVVRGENIRDLDLKSSKRIKYFEPKAAIENILYQKEMLPSPCGKLYRSKLFEGVKFVKGIIYEDLDIFYRVFEKASKIAYIDTPVYFYRTNYSSTINTWRPQRLDVLKVTEELDNYISEKYPDLMPAAKDRRLSANFNMFALCSMHEDSVNAKKCWDYIRTNRRNSLFNPKVRFKNKAGIILSYLGKNIFNLAARRIYK